MAPDVLSLAGAPYTGLRPFEAAETHLFFGREQQVDALLARLHRSRRVAVVGESGAGKSSLVRAGLLPALEAGFLAEAGSDWRILVMRPGAAPLDALLDALLASGALGAAGAGPARPFAAAELRRGPLGLLQLVRDARLPPATNLLLVVDQFEELFRFSTPAHRDEADAFVDLLLHSAAQRELPLYLVLTMRSDYLGACARFRGLPEALNDNQFLTPRLTREQVGMAIRGPARVFGGEVEEGLVATLENEVGDDPDQLPLLQHLLLRLWQEAGRRAAPPLLTLALYRELGGFHGALDQHLEQLYEALPPARQAIAEGLFKALTGGDDQARDLRRPARLGEVAAAVGTDPATLGELVEVFRAPGRNLLMPPPGQPLDADTRLDISHESLIRQWKRLRKWVGYEAADARDFLGLRARARRWADSGRDAAELVAGNDLLRALAWRQRGTTNAAWAARYAPQDTDYELTLELIDASEREDRRQRSEKRAALEREAAMAGKLKWLSGILFVAGLVAVLLALEAFRAEFEAEAREQEANALKLASEARAAFFSGSDKALRKALAAVEANRASAEAVMTLRRATAAPFRVHSSDYRSTPPAGDGARPESFARPFTPGADSFSPQGDRIVLPGADGTQIRSLDGSRVITLDDLGEVVRAAAFGPDGEIVATIGGDGTARLWDARDGSLRHTLTHGAAAVNSVAFDRERRRLLTATRASGTAGRGEAVVWDVGGGRRAALATIGYPGDDVRDAVFSPDGSRILTLAEGGYATAWDATSGRALRELAFDRVVGEGPAGGGRQSICSGAVQAGIRYGPDGATLAILDPAGRATLFDAASLVRRQPPAWQLPAHERFCALAWSQDGSRLGAATSEGRVRVWDTAHGTPLRELPRGAERSLTVAFDPTDRDRLLTAGSERGIALWQLYGTDDARPPLQIALLRGQGFVNAAAFSPDGRYLLSAADDDTVHLWQLSATAAEHPPLERLAVAADGQAPAVPALRRAAADDEPALPDGRFRYDEEHCRAAALARDGSRLALECSENEPGGRPVRRYLLVKAAGVADADFAWESKHPVAAAAFDAEAKRLAVALDNGVVHMLKLQQEAGTAKAPPDEAARRRSEHDGDVTDIAFSRDGTLLASVGRDRTVRVLDAAMLRQLALVPLPGRPSAVGFDDEDRHILIQVDAEVLAWACPVCGTVDDLVARGSALLHARDAAGDGSAMGAVKTAGR